MPKKTLFAQQRDDLLQFKSCLIDAVQQKRRIIVLTFETERDGERFFDLNLQRIDSKLSAATIRRVRRSTKFRRPCGSSSPRLTVSNSLCSFRGCSELPTIAPLGWVSPRC